MIHGYTSRDHRDDDDDDDNDNNDGIARAGRKAMTRDDCPE